MITIENPSYGYKSNPLIFNNISLEIGNGIYGLLGENGVGKTTLMHLICGLLFPKNGKCSIDGRNTAERQSEGLARYFFLPEELQMPTESIASFAARHSVFYPHFNQEEFKLNLENQPETKTLFRLLRTTEEGNAGIRLCPAYSIHPARRTDKRAGHHLPPSLETYHQPQHGR